MKKCLLALLAFIFTMVVLTSCKKIAEDTDEDKIRDLEFTVVDKTLLPEIVAAKIETELTKPFKFSYSDGEYIYIAIGYGEQTTSDYSIQVVKLYESKDYIVLKTKLIPPNKDEQAVTTPTYPFIVIKTEDLSKAVCFK